MPGLAARGQGSDIQETVTAMTDPAEPPSAPAAPATAPPARVLMVDDEPNILLSLQFLMKKAGYDVRTATDGEQALAEIARERPDIVLLDVMMPKLDGFSVCQRIKAAPEWRDVRVIMLTARGRDVEREKGRALGADDYITKPFATKDAMDRVAAALARPAAAPGAERQRAGVRPWTGATPRMSGWLRCSCWASCCWCRRCWWCSTASSGCWACRCCIFICSPPGRC